MGMGCWHVDLSWWTGSSPHTRRDISISTLCLPGDIVPLRAEKKILALAKKLEGVPGLDEHERILMARSLLATPDERWEMHQTYLRSHGLFTHSDRKKFGFKSPE